MDLVVVVDASIAYTDRHRGGEDQDQDADGFLDDNLPFLVVMLGFCAAFVIIVIVLIAVAAIACDSRRAPRAARQVIRSPF